MGDISYVDLENPTTPVEIELVEAMHHSELHLMAGYQQSVNCGMLETQVKSQGLMVAITRVLGHHMLQHHINMLCSQEAAIAHIETITNNLKLFLEENYDAAFQVAMAEAAKEATKQ